MKMRSYWGYCTSRDGIVATLEIDGRLSQYPVQPTAVIMDDE